MRLRLQMTPTRALWLANGVFWLCLAGLGALQVQQVFLAGEATPLHLESSALPALPLLPDPVLAARNPFDPTGAPWQVAGSAPAPVATSGQVRGIVVLPGIGVALTDRGPVKPGESLEAGQLMSVKTTGAVVDTPSGPQALVLPGANRPSLKDLNRAEPESPPANVSKQGKS